MECYNDTIDVLRAMTDLEAGGSHAQRVLLLALAAAGEPLKMGDVAQRIGMSRGAMTSAIDGLTQDGFVKRVEGYDPADRRSVYVEATKATLRMIRKAEALAGVA